ncbi:Fis family transcriptional regulator [Alkalihalobacillus alcalophilus ATCC 27647 = CGMCC 1.3604]|uniref:Fis family transcriptional regulator n=2 Tax=Alkalihalobacillus alcalophilus ATCC 27647 = CGMCC 1.3604 TaxID=1218173 RepID=A0A4S4K0Z4_ALKAL|nr:sigma 54-interacting transcriptional regulator [Alkalihalobacillus alcalophilus]MED1562253.1 sigma 54-interacting transcriptional regulator [Alkalihalobacillus alcalophilus]THG89639.1 Fis family transcriptional regulator [Alkalihalobacillus alcalophilus ATCC 27647 = CGMCC 1.3604]
MKTAFQLKEMAKPLTERLPINEMKIVSEDLHILDLPMLELGQDFLLENAEGNLVGWVSMDDFVLKLFQYTKELSAVYDTLLTNVEDAIAITDINGNVTAWNRKSEEMYRLKKEEIIGQPITNFFEKEALILLSTMQTQLGVNQHYNQPRPNVHVLINSAPIYVNNKIIGGLSIERDITDMVKLNEHLSETTAYLHDLEQNVNGDAEPSFQKIKGRSTKLQEAITLAKKVASTDAPVLITGESGVGKELFAEGIHQASKRNKKPFIAINCGAIPNALFESELFGYEQGAFTGAARGGKKGKFDLAKGGTLFLDEVGEMPLELQVKLLRVLQEKQYYRVGGTESIPFDVRIITATNRDIEQMVLDGRFREDLYYRLNVIAIHVPPLRERIEDVPALVQLFLKEFSFKYSTPAPHIDSEVMYAFMQHRWKGNIRQLRNIIERLVILGSDTDTINAKHLPPNFFESQQTKLTEPLGESTPTIEDTSHSINKEQIVSALDKTYGNRSAAAKILGISRATLYNKMKKYKLN